jgi:selenocysteine lyase/cysteine desulfurase
MTRLEHHANIVPWQLLSQLTAALLKAAPAVDAGNPLMSEFDDPLGPRTKLIAAKRVSNALGVEPGHWACYSYRPAPIRLRSVRRSMPMASPCAPAISARSQLRVGWTWKANVRRFAFYNTFDEIDVFLNAVHRIAEGGIGAG